MGKISDETDNVFRISLLGYDVYSATPEQCAIHSGFDYPKIEEDLEGYEIITVPSSLPEGTTVLKTVTHNYGYIPNALVYIDTNPYGSGGTNFEILPYLFFIPVIMWYDMEVTSTQLKMTFENQTGGVVGEGSGSPAGEDIGFKWQVWVND